MTLFSILCILYFVPAVIAAHRHHPQQGPIIIVDIFLGWTLIGWVVALAWACSSFTIDPLAPPKKSIWWNI